MGSYRVEINLNGFIKGRFDLNCLRMGYRYSPWTEREGEFYQGILCNDRVVKAVLKKQKGQLWLSLESNSALSSEETDWLRKRVVYCLGLEDDLSPLYELAKGDRNLQEALEALPGYRLKATPTLYEAIISAMLSQNCSSQAFFSMRERLVKTIGKREGINDVIISSFPLPEEIQATSEEALMQAGLYYRTKFIRGVAGQLSSGFLRQLKSISPEEGIETLRALKGIGDYTARVVQIYGLRRYNLLFTDGYVQKLLGALYLGTPKPKPKEIFVFAQEKWMGWQAYALDLLIAYWQSRDLKPAKLRLFEELAL